ncbi:unnamed protein product [Heterobilharzia americana]|nr:unnamed protein product [Heterobilharzia americana]
MLFFYHKCVAFVTNQICLTYFTGFSEIPSFGTIIFVCYNLTMIFLISMGYGMFERHIKEKILLSKPHLYRAVSDTFPIDFIVNYFILKITEIKLFIS